MGRTITEKILSAHCDHADVVPGDIVQCSVDFALGNDVTSPLAIEGFEALGLTEVFDRDRIALVPDHFVPNKDIAAAEQVAVMRAFAKKHHITHYFEVGQMGIEHALLPEKGLVTAGDVVIGADSHTCTYGALGAFATGVGSTDLAAVMATGRCWFRVPETMRFIYYGKMRPWVSGKDLILHTIGDIGVDGARYRAMEFSGEAITRLSMDGRLTMANMAIEAGAKNGIFEVDDVAMTYMAGRMKRPPVAYKSDPDAVFEEVREYDVSTISPQIAFPSLPGNTRPVEEAAGITLDQVVIGSCTNGRIEDLRVAAGILKGKKVHPEIRLIVFPATQAIYLQALREGLIEVFIEAGAAVSTPTCGPCLGGHMGILAKGERALATTNRNFPGRMGHPGSEVYLASPAVAAASAVTGEITHPEEVMKR
jgi:3-isopropylmalate/(R)-2-methylmalate dehydratase large subunit